MRLTLITALITLVVDQLTKLLVVHGLNLRARGEIDVFPPYLNFRMAWNEGINFGLLSRQDDLMKWILVAIALAISAAVLWWVHRERPRTAGMIAAGLLVGGAIGNVIDRLVYGAVADFLNMSCCGIENPYAFNVADIAIFLGAAALVLIPADKKAG
ncbi:signal peptidase II [Pseudooceanicola nanhaiensis]|uniref:Lipoprotein signal peptidase n=1 Tax=Pseudooceanicola nanhaiensis TaxID=375761 RepID=A0A917T1H8_9RHOB|nr:signal peptidase II [Pseudooceanicola nanhaiensis]GGM06939.1 lipoprotein signal peptidase [Pseudooceanicola nanhaiensis]